MASPVERIGAHLDSALAVHQWASRHLPAPAAGADTRLGFDLFLHLGQGLLRGESSSPTTLCQRLHCSPAELRQLLMRWHEAGLMSAAGQELRLTPRFAELLQGYVDFSSDTLVPRQELRQRYLQVAAPEPPLAKLAGLLFDRFHDLDWLYLHNYGAVCFLMALLVQKVATLHGHQARCESGYVLARRPDGRGFLLGSDHPVAEGQVPGHAFCVVDDTLIIDFGLGNLRRNFMRSFPWGLACAHQPQPPVFGQLVLSNGVVVQWKSDWVYPQSQAEFEKLEPLAEQLASRYATIHGLAPARGVGTLPPDTQPGALDEPIWPSPRPAPRLNVVGRH